MDGSSPFFVLSPFEHIVVLHKQVGAYTHPGGRVLGISLDEDVRSTVRRRLTTMRCTLVADI